MKAACVRKQKDAMYNKRGSWWLPRRISHFVLSDDATMPLWDGAVPQATVAKGMNSSMYPWQQASVVWALAQEAAAGWRSLTTSHHPHVLSVSGACGCAWHVYDGFQPVLDNHYTRFAPCTALEYSSDAPGGLLASDVGTGKTAVMLHLAVSTFNAQQGPTLVLVPNSLEAQWVAELERMYGASAIQTDPKAFAADRINLWRCCTLTYYHAYAKRCAKGSAVPPHIVLMTFEFLAARVQELGGTKVDYAAFAPTAGQYCQQHKLPTVFLDMHWARLVVDEAHELVRDHAAVVSFLNALPVQHVWALSATPDLPALAPLLRLHWRGTGHNNKDITPKLPKATMDYVAVAANSLRVSKHQMTHRTELCLRNVELRLTEQERQVMQYLRKLNQTHMMVCTDLNSFLHEGNFGGRECTLEAFWQHMRGDNEDKLAKHSAKVVELEKELEQLRNDVLPALEVDSYEHSHAMQKQRRLLQQHAELVEAVAPLQRNQAFLDGLDVRIREALAHVTPCPICMDDDEGANRSLTITPCGHLFCTPCIESWLAQRSLCPMCRKVTHAPQLRVITEHAAEPQEQPKHSTKIDFLVSHLRYVFETTQDKVIVFCDFAPTLVKVQALLKAEGIDATNMLGNVHTKGKNARRFKKQKLASSEASTSAAEAASGTSAADCRVMLLNTQLSNSGLDFIEANRIIFLDTHNLTADVVKQACGRCVRLGQAKAVDIAFLTVPEFDNMDKVRELHAVIQGHFNCSVRHDNAI